MITTRRNRFTSCMCSVAPSAIVVIVFLRFPCGGQWVCCLLDVLLLLMIVMRW
jgi:hypothetical protein